MYSPVMAMPPPETPVIWALAVGSFCAMLPVADRWGLEGGAPVRAAGAGVDLQSGAEPRRARHRGRGAAPALNGAHADHRRGGVGGVGGAAWTSRLPAWSVLVAARVGGT